MRTDVRQENIYYIKEKWQKELKEHKSEEKKQTNNNVWNIQNM